jgi:hypothetical protein
MDIYIMMIEIGYEITQFDQPVIYNLNTDYWNSISDSRHKVRDFTLERNQMDSDEGWFFNTTNTVSGYEVGDVFSDDQARTTGSTTGKFFGVIKIRGVFEL